MKEFDVIIVGSGIAALQLAVHLPTHLNVIILTKSDMKDSNSSLAQGGIAAAVDSNDHPGFHYADTIEAGRKINYKPVVRSITKEAGNMVQELTKFNCKFDVDINNKLQLGKEGAHSHARIVHGGGDRTGEVIVDCLIKRLKSNVSIVENEQVRELLVNKEGHCFGVKSFGGKEKIHTFVASHVVLASGGAGQLYRFTSNSQQATGEGIALAYWAGAKIKDMEFVQFHPTLLYCNGQTKGLVSEAVRGEGGKLVDEDNNNTMEGIHPLGDLAPRHITAQSIYHSLKKGKRVFLDVRSIARFEQRFPTVAQLCRRNGVHQKIPVAPGCHFIMGGIETDHFGRTNVPGLYAIGETACTGLHGANRLASNSLLEALFCGKQLAEYIEAQPSSPKINKVSAGKAEQDKSNLFLPGITDIQYQMMENAGIVRSEESLRHLLSWIESFSLEKWVEVDFARLTKSQWTIVSMLQTSYLIAEAALTRTESRGGHYRSDFPFESEEWLDHHIIQTKETRENYESVKA
ncbi:L-aspartate oxidase [Halobacillus andaensis]|uniref:L-aspartate oxidase n=1 Tax=Halobacillus andaensis TaxID=1176239 RepID=UPI003D70A840